MHLPMVLRDLGAGRITFDDVVAQFKEADFVVPLSAADRAATIGEFYNLCEEVPFDDDVPSLLSGASFARTITDDQERQLLAIYVKRLTEGEAMTSYYAEGHYGIVSFETDPTLDVNADAKFWSPETEKWNDCPGSTGIGADVKWSGDFYPIPESAVPEMQQRCRDQYKG